MRECRRYGSQASDQTLALVQLSQELPLVCRLLASRFPLWVKAGIMWRTTLQWLSSTYIN